MSLKHAITSIYKLKTEYAFPEQALEQAESVLYLSDDLYTDSKRFIYELIQNADDASIAGKPSDLWVSLMNDWLIVAHTGNKFSERDVRGLCGINDSNKKQDIEKTGYKGIGFKAVFSKSNYVIIYTNGEYFRFDGINQVPWRSVWPESQQTWEERTGLRFKQPWQLTPVWTDEVNIPSDVIGFIKKANPVVVTALKLRPEKKSDVMSGIVYLTKYPTILLFLRNIASIKFDYGEKIEIKRQHKSGDIVSIESGKISTNWLIKSMVIRIPLLVKTKLKDESNVPPKLLSSETTTITFAAKLSDGDIISLPDSESILFSYLPTETADYKFPVLVNATFITNSNRQQLHQDSVWNQWLFYQLPTEMLMWISELVGRWKSQSYQLIPSIQGVATRLASRFNEGRLEALKVVKFIMSTEEELLKPSQVLIDNTGLSGKIFFGVEALRKHINKKRTSEKLHEFPLVEVYENKKRLTDVGVSEFNWTDFKELVSDENFAASHTPQDNALLVEYLYTLHKDFKSLNEVAVKSSTFIMDHRHVMKTPALVYFPPPNDSNWASSVQVSYLNPAVLEFCHSKIELRRWLGDLGITEKTDLSYLDKTIIPGASTFVNLSNAIATIHWLFDLFLKDEVGRDRLQQLGQLKILTSQGSLIEAKSAYLSDSFQPRLKLEANLKRDIFISAGYISDHSRIADLRRFFSLMGAREEISEINLEPRKQTFFFLNEGLGQAYFNDADKKFQPWQTEFTAAEFKGIHSLSLIELLDNWQSSVTFWNFVVQNITPNLLSIKVIAFWGNSGKPGWETGDAVINYIPWHITHIPCLPTAEKRLELSNNIFLNTEDAVQIAADYLPIAYFDVPLSADWRSFFQFKIDFAAIDLITILKRIGEDATDKGKIREENKPRVQKIYLRIIKLLPNLSSEELDILKAKCNDLKFLAADGTLKPGSELTFYADGDSTIFSDLFVFIQLNREVKSESNLEELLSLFGIQTIRMSDFTITRLGGNSESSLNGKVKQIIPYLARWVSRQSEISVERMEEEIVQKFSKLTFVECDNIELVHDQRVIKNMNEYVIDDEIGFLRPWQSGYVMLNLPEIISKKLGIRDYEKELIFLMRETIEDIRVYFQQQSIELPAIPESNVSQTDSDESIVIPQVDKQIDYERLRALIAEENKAILPVDNHTPGYLLLSGLKSRTSKWAGNVYHFAHIENAANIINEGLLKSRSKASFKDSASANAIKNTEHLKKDFVRFYFRPLTPTQYYNENLGRGSDSRARLGTEPVCPVPIFIKIPLDAIIRLSTSWQISLGNMAKAETQYGNTEEIVRQFDFNGVFLDPYSDRYFASAQQEFLIQDQLALKDFDFELICQDESARNSLIAMMNDKSVGKRIRIDDSYFHSQNPRVKVESTSEFIRFELTSPLSGLIVAQFDHPKIPYAVDMIQSYESSGKVTVISTNTMCLWIESPTILMSVYYAYNGELWLIHTNEIRPTHNFGYVNARYASLSELSTDTEFIDAVSLDPRLRLLYNLPIGGPDSLSLRKHTLIVINNYRTTFSKVKNEMTETEFCMMLAIHDIGKPLARLDGDKSKQHIYTLKLIENLLSSINIPPDKVSLMKCLINGDPIGRYLDDRYSVSLELTVESINSMAQKVSMNTFEFFSILATYYQCDAGGYPLLKEKLFLYLDGVAVFDQQKSRWSFNEPIEQKFVLLESEIQKQSAVNNN